MSNFTLHRLGYLITSNFEVCIVLTLGNFVGYNVEFGVALNCQRGPKVFCSKEYKEEIVLT